MREGCLILLCLSGGVALAEPPRQQPAELHYRFDDERVVGEDSLPGHGLLTARRPGRRTSLIEIKTSLVEQLLESAEDL